LATQLGTENHSPQPGCIEWDDTMTGQSINNGYNNLSAEIGWPIKNEELSSQLVGQQWIKSLKGLILVSIYIGYD